MVTGGYPRESGKKSEVIDVQDPTRTCASLPDVPYGEYYMPNCGVIDGKLIVCQYYKCFELQNNGNGWTEFATLTNRMKYGVGAVVNNSIFLFGSAYVSNAPFSEFLYSDGSTEDGPDLYMSDGNGDFGMCAVTLSTGNVMLMGGELNQQRVGVFNPTTGSYTSMAELNFDRYFSACTTFYSAKHGQREVVYIGGGDNNGGYKTVEILDYTLTETWEQSK